MTAATTTISTGPTALPMVPPRKKIDVYQPGLDPAADRTRDMPEGWNAPLATPATPAKAMNARASWTKPRSPVHTAIRASVIGVRRAVARRSTIAPKTGWRADDARPTPVMTSDPVTRPKPMVAATSGTRVGYTLL
jgi:hypothetical protein